MLSLSSIILYNLYMTAKSFIIWTYHVFFNHFLDDGLPENITLAAPVGWQFCEVRYHHCLFQKQCMLFNSYLIELIFLLTFLQEKKNLVNFIHFYYSIIWFFVNFLYRELTIENPVRSGCNDIINLLENETMDFRAECSSKII